MEKKKEIKIETPKDNSMANKKIYVVEIKGQNREYPLQQDAIDWAKKLLEAGLFYIELKEKKV